MLIINCCAILNMVASTTKQEAHERKSYYININESVDIIGLQNYWEGIKKDIHHLESGTVFDHSSVELF